MTINNKACLSLTQTALQVGARCGVVYRSWRKIACLIVQKIIVSARLNVQLLQIIALLIVQFQSEQLPYIHREEFFSTYPAISNDEGSLWRE